MIKLEYTWEAIPYDKENDGQKWDCLFIGLFVGSVTKYEGEKEYHTFSISDVCHDNRNHPRHVGYSLIVAKLKVEERSTDLINKLRQ